MPLRWVDGISDAALSEGDGAPLPQRLSFPVVPGIPLCSSGTTGVQGILMEP